MNKIEPTFTDDFGDIRALTVKAGLAWLTAEKKKEEIRLQEPEVSSYEPDVSSLNKEKVNNPDHYHSHPSGVACIDVVEHMGFNLGNSTKYIWRADLKNDDGGLEDLNKALWYIEREINKRLKK